jgi:hypothetical protein
MVKGPGAYRERQAEKGGWMRRGLFGGGFGEVAECDEPAVGMEEL